MTTETMATAPTGGAPRPIRLLKRELPALFLPYLAVLALSVPAAGLFFRLIGASGRAEFDSAVTTPSPRALFTLLVIGVLLSVVTVVRACIDAAVSRTLIGSGIVRRRILFYHFLHSLVHSAIVFLLMMLVVLVTCVLTGDFAGRVEVDGEALANLWTLPVIIGFFTALPRYWTGFFVAMLFVKFRTHTAVSIAALLALIIVSGTSEGSAVDVIVEVMKFPTLWDLLKGHLVDSVIFAWLSELMLRNLPVRR